MVTIHRPVQIVIIEAQTSGTLPIVTAWSPSCHWIEAPERLECTEHQESSFQGRTNRETGDTVVSSRKVRMWQKMQSLHGQPPDVFGRHLYWSPDAWTL